MTRKTIPDYPIDYPVEWKAGYKFGHDLYTNGFPIKSIKSKKISDWDFWQNMAYVNGALDGWITNAEIDIDLYRDDL